MHSGFWSRLMIVMAFAPLSVQGQSTTTKKGYDYMGYARSCTPLKNPLHCPPQNGVVSDFREACLGISGQVLICGCQKILCSKRITSAAHMKTF